MKDISICLFAWDLCDEGVEEVLGRVADMGATSLYLAATYHAGWFVLPHNPKRKCHFAEDGVAYFQPQETLYEGTPLKPKVAGIAADTDWFTEAGQLLDRFGLRMTAWTVCNHNTPLGLKHPEHTVRNAFGDYYPHALCPASRAVRDYVRALSVDLASRYPLQSIFLEAPNYRGRRHGHHHERELVKLGHLENTLLDISFSEHDLAAARAAGVDGDRVRQSIREHLTKYLDAAPRLREDLPLTMAQFLDDHPMTADYLAVLDEQVSRLVAEIKSDIRQWDVELEGVERIAAYDVQVVGAYGLTPEEVARKTTLARSQIPLYQQIRVGFRLGGDPSAIESPKQARECVQAASESGADSVFFYNYSESPLESLEWIRYSVGI
ncbi:MAG: hypothetical protein JXM70_07915 [Pirellulales bacterium]|nr:hypothetical protein [Pirellulales bacterium]